MRIAIAAFILKPSLRRMTGRLDSPLVGETVARWAGWRTWWRRARPRAQLAGIQWGGACLDLLFPPRCAYCSVDLPSGRDNGAARMMLCADCQHRLAPPPLPACRRCGSRISEHEDPHSRCRRCRGRRLRFRAVVHLGVYQDDLRLAVLHAKHPYRESLAAAMSQLLWRRRGERITAWRPEVVVPVPMFWRRRVVRGTNSPEIIAARLAANLGLPYHRMLRRHRATLPQSGLSPKARVDNVRGSIRFLEKDFDCQRARVLLVDDVLTTGATGNEAAKALLGGGASQVYVAVLARAEGPA